jgi:hypothetical protein
MELEKRENPNNGHHASKWPLRRPFYDTSPKQTRYPPATGGIKTT